MISAVSHAQFADVYLTDPAVNFSWSSDTRWGTNTAFGYRATLGGEVPANSLHVQAAQFVTYEVGFAGSLGLGLMYRELFDEQSPEELRLTSQYSNAQFFNALRIVHRGRLEQRFRGGITTHRIRYRLSADIPLSGLALDTGEFYAALSTESLLNLEDESAPEWDQRFTLKLGHKTTSSLKLQLNTQYRFEAYNQQVERRLFFSLETYYSF